MPNEVLISDELFARLQKHAVPFVDTPETVIERALRALEAGDEDPAISERTSEVRTFNPAAPPDLKFTSVLEASVAGAKFKKSESYWNTVMLRVIAEAARLGNSTQDILDLLTVNSEEGFRDDSGYKYVESANVSIQGQESNAAWRQAHTLASSFGIELDITFAWQDHPKAKSPNQKGTFFVQGA